MSRKPNNGKQRRMELNLPGPWRLLSLLGTALGAVGAGLQLRRDWLETRSIKEGRVYSLSEAACLLGASERELLEEVQSGALPARAIAGRHLVLGEALLEYLRAEPAP